MSHMTLFMLLLTAAVSTKPTARSVLGKKSDMSLAEVDADGNVRAIPNEKVQIAANGDVVLEQTVFAEPASSEKMGVQRKTVSELIYVGGEDPAGNRKSATNSSLQEGEDTVIDEDDVGENCAGSTSVDPRYCTGRYSTCKWNAIKVGDNVTLRIRVRNRANYETRSGDPVYVPARIEAGKRFQIAFACADSKCEGAYSTIGSGNAFKFKAVDSPNSPGSTFTAGRAPGFRGVDKCSNFANANTACGYFTVGTDIQVEGDGYATVGYVVMEAVKADSGKSFIAHVASDVGFIHTTGGICSPHELSSSASGTAGARFA